MFAAVDNYTTLLKGEKNKDEEGSKKKKTINKYAVIGLDFCKQYILNSGFF